MKRYAKMLALSAGVLALPALAQNPSPPPPQDPNQPTKVDPKKDPAKPDQTTYGAPQKDVMAVPGSTTPKTEDKRLTSSDKKFFEEAALAGLSEVQLSRHMIENSRHDRVKDFARMMVDDHSRVNAELVSLGDQLGLTVTKTIDKSKQKDFDKLIKTDAAKIDEAYAKMMVDAHKDDVKLFEKAAKSDLSEIRTWAERKLPTLRHHLAEAESLVDNLKKRAGR